MSDWKQLKAAFQRQQDNPLTFSGLAPDAPHCRIEIHPSGIFVAEARDYRCHAVQSQEHGGFAEACQGAADCLRRLHGKRGNKIKTFLVTVWPDQASPTELNLSGGAGNFPSLAAFLNTVRINPGAPKVELNPDAFCLACELRGHNKILKVTFESPALSALVKANLPVVFRYGPLAALSVLTAAAGAPDNISYNLLEGGRVTYTSIRERRLNGIRQDEASRLDRDTVSYFTTFAMPQDSLIGLVQIAAVKNFKLPALDNLNHVGLEELMSSYPPPAAWRPAILSTFMPLGMWQDGHQFAA